MDVVIRTEQPADAGAIDAVIEEAFRTAPHAAHTEQFIVRALRRSGHLALSLVAEVDGSVAGHVAASPVEISSGDPGWYGIGPLAVAPAAQRQGIGSALMRECLAALRRRGARGCMLVGEPAYYGRFGFRAEPSLRLPDVPPQYFQAVSFGGPVPEGTVRFDEAFAATS